MIAGTVGFRQFTLLFTPGGAVERGCEWGLIFERNFKFQRAELLVFAMHRDFYGPNYSLLRFRVGPIPDYVRVRFPDSSIPTRLSLYPATLSYLCVDPGIIP